MSKIAFTVNFLMKVSVCEILEPEQFFQRDSVLRFNSVKCSVVTYSYLKVAVIHCNTFLTNTSRFPALFCNVS